MRTFSFKSQAMQFQFKIFLSICLLGISASVLGQMPLPNAAFFETDLNKIDSLTEKLYTSIPSHSSFGDSLSHWPISKQDFENQMSLLGSSIVFPHNEYVANSVKYLMNQSESYFLSLHGRMKTFFPIFEQILDENNLPKELKYVSIIESNLHCNAQSWCGAMGLWQFMPYTGRDYNMQINYSVDERKSIYISTQKACEFFASSYKQFGDWLLAIASYNCGPGNVMRAIKLAGGAKDFWKIKPYLPKETQNYVPKFIAAAYVLNFTKNASFSSNQTSLILVPTPVKITISLSLLAKYLNLTEEEIHYFNREWLTKKVTGNKSILLPYKESMRFVSEEDSFYAFADREQKRMIAERPVYVKKMVPSYHYVSKGQNLTFIARKYGVTVGQIKVWNGLKSNTAPLGRNLLIYKYQYVLQTKQNQG